ncbi:MAG: hypothetical protein R6V35_03020, partial [Candidatus Nanohaloarchaea archaeon]
EHSIELNETNLPVKQINFSSSEEGTFNLSRTSIPHNGTMESIFQAETDLDNSFNLRVEASNRWMEENNFSESQISFFRFEEGWIDLNPDKENRSNSLLMSSELESFSVFGVGVDQACHSMEQVYAVENGSCQAYGTICQAPDSAEVVESCESAENESREQQVRERIQEARETGGDEEDLRQAEAALAAGNIDAAEEIVNQSSQTGLQLPELKAPQMNIGILTMVSGGLIVIIAGIVTSVYLLYPVYREKILVRRINKLTLKIKQKAQKGENIEQLARMVLRADEALIEGNYDEAGKIIDDAERIN